MKKNITDVEDNRIRNLMNLFLTAAFELRDVPFYFDAITLSGILNKFRTKNSWNELWENANEQELLTKIESMGLNISNPENSQMSDLYVNRYFKELFSYIKELMDSEN